MAAAKKPIGEITHWYDHVSVGVIKLNGKLKTGDSIVLANKKGEELFTQTVGSMQVEHEKIETAKKGDDVGLQLDSKVKEGTLVFKA